MERAGRDALLPYGSLGQTRIGGVSDKEMVGWATVCNGNKDIS